MFESPSHPQERPGDDRDGTEKNDSVVNKLQESIFQLQNRSTEKKTEIPDLSQPSKREIEVSSKDPDYLSIGYPRHKAAKEWVGTALELFAHADVDKNFFLDKTELESQKAAWSEYLLHQYEQIGHINKDVHFSFRGVYPYVKLVKIPADHLGISRMDLILFPYVDMLPDLSSHASVKDNNYRKTIANDSKIDEIKMRFTPKIDWPVNQLSNGPRKLHELLSRPAK